MPEFLCTVPLPRGCFLFFFKKKKQHLFFFFPCHLLIALPLLLWLSIAPRWRVWLYYSCVCGKPSQHAAHWCRQVIWLTNTVPDGSDGSVWVYVWHFYSSCQYQWTSVCQCHTHICSLTWQLASNIINSCHSNPFSMPIVLRDSEIYKKKRGRKGREKARDRWLKCTKA